MARDPQTPEEISIGLHIGKRVRRRRRIMGLTQREVADIIGTQFQQVQKYESGANRITGLRIYQLSQALKIPVSYFFQGLPGIPLTSEPTATNASAGFFADYEGLSPALKAQVRALVKTLAATPSQEHNPNG